MRDERARATRRWTAFGNGVAPLVVVSLLLLTVMAGALLTGPQVVRLPVAEHSVVPAVPESREIPTPSAPPTATPGASGRFGDSPWLATVMTVLAALILGAGAVAAAWLLYRHRHRLRLARAVSVEQAPAKDERAGGGQAVTAAVRAGLEELDDEDGDPRRTVIACWVRLETAATSAGVERRPDDAPADLVTRLLRSYDVDPNVLQGLAGLYRRARYAPADVDVGMRAQARDLLERLRAELSAALAHSASTDAEHAESAASEPTPSGTHSQGPAGQGTP